MERCGKGLGIYAKTRSRPPFRRNGLCHQGRRPPSRDDARSETRPSAFSDRYLVGVAVRKHAKEGAQHDLEVEP